MTRFARAKGSKASNERVPEEATSWTEMKKQLDDKIRQQEESKKRKEAEEMRDKNYKSFLKAKEDDEIKHSKWVDFSDVQEVPNSSKTTEQKSNEKKRESKSKSKKRKIANCDESKTVQEGPNSSKTTEQKSYDKSFRENKSRSKKRKIADCDENKTVKERKLKVKKSDEINNNNKKSLNKKAATHVKKDKIKPPKENLTDDDLIKIQKKKEKKIKQIEKRNKFKPSKWPGKSFNNQSKKFSPTNVSKPRLEEHKRRKPLIKSNKVTINGKEIELIHFDGYPVKKEDYDRLVKLRKEMISKGIPRSEVNKTLKLERRRAEKALAREKKNVCFNCRQSGHVLSECPNLNNELSGTGICFKCGSTEHTHFECKVVRNQEYKYATCFICKEQGHIARQCPDNAKGLYPKGGACKLCGDVTHLKKDCPKFQQEQESSNIFAETIDNGNVEALESEKRDVVRTRTNKIIKF